MIQVQVCGFNVAVHGCDDERRDNDTTGMKYLHTCRTVTMMITLTKLKQINKEFFVNPFCILIITHDDSRHFSLSAGRRNPSYSLYDLLCTTYS